jgi:hypothetical protein
MVSPDGYIGTSTNGADWTIQSLTGVWLRIAYGNGYFIAIANNNTATLTDGVNWIVKSLTGDWKYVLYIEEHSITRSGNIVLTQNGSGNKINILVTQLGKNHFFIIAGTDNMLISTNNGQTWT